MSTVMELRARYGVLDDDGVPTASVTMLVRQAVIINHAVQKLAAGDTVLVTPSVAERWRRIGLAREATPAEEGLRLERTIQRQTEMAQYDLDVDQQALAEVENAQRFDTMSRAPASAGRNESTVIGSDERPARGRKPEQRLSAGGQL